MQPKCWHHFFFTAIFHFLFLSYQYLVESLKTWFRRIAAFLVCKLVHPNSIYKNRIVLWVLSVLIWTTTIVVFSLMWSVSPQMCIVVISVLAVIVYRVIAQVDYCPSLPENECLLVATIVSSLLNAISIVILGLIYNIVAKKLTDWGTIIMTVINWLVVDWLLLLIVSQLIFVISEVRSLKLFHQSSILGISSSSLKWIRCEGQLNQIKPTLISTKKFDTPCIFNKCVI